MTNLFRKSAKLNSAGDTIVEVLIVLAVLGMAFSISYATANRGLQQSRNAQEHSQALGIINSQVELLRSAFARQAGSTLPVNPVAFCLSSPSSSPANVTTLSAGFDENIANDNLNTGTYPGPCTQNSLYNISIINRTPASTDGGLYDFRVRWFGTGTLGRQQEELTYRIGNIAFTGGAGGYGNAQSPPPPPLSGALNVEVKAIPQAAGNTTPSCAAASQSKSGTTVRLTDNSTGGTLVGTKSTDVNSLAAFTGIQQGDTFTATVSRSGYGVCPGGSTGVASVTTPVPVITKTIYPICTTTTTTIYSGYWAYGARRPELDGYYYTIPPAVPGGTYPGAYSNFVAGNIKASGNFIYVFSGDVGRAGQGLLYYWLWQTYWVDTSTTTITHSCPS